ncbi:hypothetical protein SDC9_61945 [bioreactor metagenome]|uniref:Uncharacterized protein n=1 Tax=bioreactor metagenome TaxID=1076179 RepID=A0A644XNC3_9ZZZZ
MVPDFSRRAYPRRAAVLRYLYADKARRGGLDPHGGTDSALQAAKRHVHAESQLSFLLGPDHRSQLFRPDCQPVSGRHAAVEPAVLSAGRAGHMGVGAVFGQALWPGPAGVAFCERSAYMDTGSSGFRHLAVLRHLCLRADI